jgi:hypothetical protein
MRRRNLLPKTLLPLFVLLLFGCQEDPTGPSEYDAGPRLVVIPEAAGMLIGQTLQLSALIRDQNGRVTDAGHDTDWESSDSRVADVNEDGTVWALAEGHVTITAASNGHGARAEIYVTRVPVNWKW